MTGTTIGILRARRTSLLLAATLSAAILAGGVFPAPASAITREQVIARGMHWVKKRVPYSQRRYHQGYRQDCSGFVSMAWNVKTSYTTYSISRVSRRIRSTSFGLATPCSCRARPTSCCSRSGRIAHTPATSRSKSPAAVSDMP